MTNPITFTTDEEHKATLAMLEEVVGYLERLPPVPTTRHLSARVREHLNQPKHRLVQQSQREWAEQGPWTEQGFPLLQVSLVGNSLTILLPEGMTGPAQEHALREIAARLTTEEGITLGLRPGGSVVLDGSRRRTSQRT